MVDRIGKGKVGKEEKKHLEHEIQKKFHLCEKLM